jgi:hypothetical protein
MAHGSAIELSTEEKRETFAGARPGLLSPGIEMQDNPSLAEASESCRRSLSSEACARCPRFLHNGTLPTRLPVEDHPHHRVPSAHAVQLGSKPLAGFTGHAALLCDMSAEVALHLHCGDLPSKLDTRKFQEQAQSASNLVNSRSHDSEPGPGRRHISCPTVRE